MKPEPIVDSAESVDFAAKLFSRATGISSIPTETALIGNKTFLKFVVGREAPLYDYALHQTQKALPALNEFAGAIMLQQIPARNFPSSLESKALLTLLTRSTKEVAEGARSTAYKIPYLPFQGGEDHQLAQPANHIVLGRRGVGKSTLIARARELLRDSHALVVVLDVQTYSLLQGDELVVELFRDICEGLARSADDTTAPDGGEKLIGLADEIGAGSVTVGQLPVKLKRVLRNVAGDRQAYVFLDDFHLIDLQAQPTILEILTGALKGANGWLKVSGLSSRLNHYETKTGRGLQVPGDAQYIRLDLTLTDPESTEAHLRGILGGFLNAVGYQLTNSVIQETSLRRLAWANAGVPRDFLQMFARALEHAQRSRHSMVTLSDVNVAIGEFGQQKMDELQTDARNDAGRLRRSLEEIERFCLDDKQVNAFLVRSEDSTERDIVRDLADLRMVHLIRHSVTPSRAGERYEAYILDYSIFTGFRRRKGIREMLPEESQFKASELRALPKIGPGLFGLTGTGMGVEEGGSSAGDQ